MGNRCYLDEDFVLASASMDAQDCTYCGELSVIGTFEEGKRIYWCRECLMNKKIENNALSNIETPLRKDAI